MAQHVELLEQEAAGFMAHVVGAALVQDVWTPLQDTPVEVGVQFAVPLQATATPL